MRKLLLLLVMLMPGLSCAAVVVTPSVAGYGAGAYRAAQGAFTMAAANEGFIAQAVTNVGGRAVTMPATLRMAANAGQIALTGMRLNPWGIAGTLAAGWLLSEGLDYVNGQWMKQSGETYPGGVVLIYNGNSVGPYPDKQTACSSWGGSSVVYDAGSDRCKLTSTGALYSNTWYYPQPAVPNYAPAVQADWDALPSPLPSVAPELPYAPYMPNGVPVMPPEYSPQDLPLGDPYTAPDGSTVQDRAKISPQPNGQVTIVTYNITVNDAQGNPVASPTPTPTPDPPPDLCSLHPDSVACMSSGGPPTFTPPTDGGAPADPSIVAAGGAIDWHQHFLDESSACGLADVNYSVMNQQFTIPLSSLCQYLPILRAVVIFLASIVSIRMFALAPW